MPTFFKIKDGWSLDERLGDMLRALDESREVDRSNEFRDRLKALMQEYEVDEVEVLEWIQLGLMKGSQ